MSGPGATLLPSVEFALWPNRLCFGAGLVARLSEYIAQVGGRRAVVVCGRTVGEGDLLSRVRESAGDALVGVYAGVEMQTPLPAVEQSLAYIRERDADVVISVGGGSAIDHGKGLVLLATAGADFMRYCRNPEGERRSAPDLPAAQLKHIAIPTTSGSSSETLPTAGLRDPASGLKLLFRDQQLLPHLAILDPEMTVACGPRLTATSGMTAVARCVEALYSVQRQPLSTALALEALRLLWSALPKAVEEPGDLASRADCQLACLMSGIAANNALPVLVHAIGHVVGGRYGLQHGVAHAILLAPVMRLLLPTTGGTQNDVLRVTGGDSHCAPDVAGRSAADRMAAFVAALPVPARLRDVGMAESDVDAIADHVEHEYMMKNAPRPIARDEIDAVLRAAW